MKKSEQKLPLYLIITSLFVVSVSLISLQSFFSQKVSTDTRSKAAGPSAGVAGNTLTVCTEGCPYAGVAGLQQALNTAQNGDIINISGGTFSGPSAIPMGLGSAIFVSSGRGAADTCFVRIQDKNITINGGGATLFGEGHDKPYQDPYQNRAGLCVVNSKITIQGLHIKEFQKRCLVAYNSQLVIKNSTIDGCDEGGASLLSDSSGVFVNNMFAEMNFGAIMLWQNSKAVIVNNNFYNAAVLFFYHPGTNDQARADIINNVFSEIKSDIAQISWWKADPAQLKSSKLSYNIIYRAKDYVCDPSAELWCDNFPGKITADPLYTAPVTDPRGVAAWADFGFKDGSPAVGAGDPSIPGPRNLGTSGGPCTDPNSSVCSSFISQALSQLAPVATPTPVLPTAGPFIPPTEPAVPINNPNPPDSSLPPSNSQKTQPPITYYLPPTMSFSNSNQLNGQTGNQTSETVTPTAKPTPKPIIDIGKTVESAKNTWSNFITSVINFTKTVLP